MGANEVTESMLEREQLIAERAFELFEARGGEPGRDHEDWREAERQLIEEGVIEARPAEEALAANTAP